MCSIQRPLDSQDDVRVATEAQAVLGVLRLCESGQVTLVASGALLFELEKNPHPVRKDYAEAVLSRAGVFTATDQRVEARARRFEVSGMKPLDALHLASAVEADADFFCTCDDRLLKRARAVQTGRTRVVSPLDLVTEVST
ncbi:MAG: PIN domain-containing protein [Deltaproteobacteria bacterium]|nr:PIN domain-containing protein [Deltaproteobacteria bacterium]